MHFDAGTFLCALGLAFIIEGIPYFLFAERMRDMLTSLAASPPLVLRLMGLCGMGLGFHAGWARSPLMVIRVCCSASSTD